MTMIERALTEKCSTSSLKINLHIESKLKKWEKQYEIVYDMLNILDETRGSSSIQSRQKNIHVWTKQEEKALLNI